MNLEKYYEDYFDLFLHPGWKQYIEDAKDAYDAIDLESSKDWDSYLIQRTTKQNLKAVLRMEELMKDAYDRMKEEATNAV